MRLLRRFAPRNDTGEITLLSDNTGVILLFVMTQEEFGSLQWQFLFHFNVELVQIVARSYFKILHFVQNDK